MGSVEMVRCYLTRSAGEEGDVRYVPLEIFKMWRFLMERVHHLSVTSAEVSRWIPDDDAPPDIQPADGEADAVIQVRFHYAEGEGVARPVVRYFPADNFDTIYGYFRQHFADEHIMEGVTHRRGRYLSGSAAVPYTG